MKIAVEIDPCKTCDFCSNVCDEEVEYCMIFGNYNQREENKIKKLVLNEVLETECGE